MAQEAASPWNVSGSATLASDYVFRGFSQTDEEPAVQGSATLSHESGFAATLWGSNVDFNDGDEASVEIDGTLAYTFSLDPVDLTLGGIYYAYPGADSDLNYDYAEAFAGAAYTLPDDVAVLTGQIFYSPDFFAGSGDAVYLNAAADVPLRFMEKLKFTGAVGHQWIDDEDQFGAPDYLDWTAGLSYVWNPATVSLKYYDTNVSEGRCSGLCGARIVGAVGVSF